MGYGCFVRRVKKSEIAQTSEVISFGNTIVSGTLVGTNAMTIRQLAMIGDSRVNGSSSGRFAAEVAHACGEWVWCKPDTFNTGVGGSSIFHARTTQVPQAIATGAKTFVVLSGTNGAINSNDIGQTPTDSLADRQSQMLGLLSALDSTENTIFLCNEMPNKVSPITQLHYDYHTWLNGLTSATAGLVNATLTIVNTWDAVRTAGTGINTNLDPRWANDYLHPANMGQERMAYAVWQAMNSRFTSPCIDFYNPTIPMFKTGSLVNINRGQVPPGWTDFTAADSLTYSTAGTGPNWIITVTNGAAAKKSLNLRFTLPSQTVNAVVSVDYELVPELNPSLTSRLYESKFGGQNWDRGTGTNTSSNVFWIGDSSSTHQEQWMGGRRRATILIGKTVAPSRFDFYFGMRPGQVLKIHGAGIYER